MKIGIHVLFLICLLSFGKGLVNSGYYNIKSRSLTFIEAFSYVSNSTYEFEITSYSIDDKPKLLILIFDEENDCKEIGKTCNYELMEQSDICKSKNNLITTFSKKMYPIIIPPNNTYSDDNRDSLVFNSSSVYYYATLYPELYKNFSIIDGENAIFAYLFNNTSNSTNTTKITKIITNIKGTVSRKSYIYFSVLNCYYLDFGLDVYYQLLNYINEQLSATEIPHKVYSI